MFRQPVPVWKFTASVRPLEWICAGFFASVWITMLNGEWKAGETTLLSIVLSRFGTGGTIVGHRNRNGPQLPLQFPLQPIHEIADGPKSFAHAQLSPLHNALVKIPDASGCIRFTNSLRWW